MVGTTLREHPTLDHRDSTLPQTHQTSATSPPACHRPPHHACVQVINKYTLEESAHRSCNLPHANWGHVLAPPSSPHCRLASPRLASPRLACLAAAPAHFTHKNRRRPAVTTGDGHHRAIGPRAWVSPGQSILMRSESVSTSRLTRPLSEPLRRIPGMEGESAGPRAGEKPRLGGRPKASVGGSSSTSTGGPIGSLGPSAAPVFCPLRAGCLALTRGRLPLGDEPSAALPRRRRPFGDGPSTSGDGASIEGGGAAGTATGEGTLDV